MLATALTVYRKNCRLTQKRLAEISGVDRSIISAVERGVCECDGCCRRRLMKVMLDDERHFHPEKAAPKMRGKALQLMLDALPEDMAAAVYRSLIIRLRKYVAFEIGVIGCTEHPEPPRKKKRPYSYYKYEK